MLEVVMMIRMIMITEKLKDVVQDWSMRLVLMVMMIIKPDEVVD
jgi:hypothetical protein